MLLVLYTRACLGGFKFVEMREVPVLASMMRFPIFTMNEGFHKGENFTVVLFSDMHYIDITANFLCVMVGLKIS